MIGRIAGFGALLAATALVACLWPPFFFDYAGSDPGDYVNAAAQRAFQHESASVFFPPSFDGLDRDVALRVFTDSRFEKKRPSPAEPPGAVGIMTPFVRVTRANEVKIAHDNINARILAFFFQSGLRRPAYFFNYALLFLGVLVMWLVIEHLTTHRWGSFLAAFHMIVLPSFITGARFPMSEALAVVLLWFMVLLFLKYGDEHTYPAFLFLPLAHTRLEFVPIFFMFCFWAGAMRRADPATLGVIGLFILIAPPFEAEGIQPVMSLAAYGIGYVIASPRVTEATRGLRKRAKTFLDVRGAYFGLSLGLLALFVGLDVLRAGFEQGETFGPLRYSRYSTFELLLGSTGVPLLVLGFLGLSLGSKDLIRRLPGLIVLILLPQLVVFINLRSTPAEVFSYTRRFHTFVYPVLLIGLGVTYRWIDCYVRARSRRPFIAAFACLAVACLTIAGHQRGLHELPRDYLTSEYLDRFHADAAEIPPGAIVILAPDKYGKRAQLPLRAFHGLWSFVVWDFERLPHILDALDARGLVLIDQRVAEHVAMALDPPHYTLDVRHGPGADAHRVITLGTWKEGS